MMHFRMNRCLFLMYLHFTVASTALVQMRVVKETASYGSFGNIYGDAENTNQLYTQVPPANFSGPALLKRLEGKCYNLTQERYRYVLCPFQNITQYEITPRWNAYHGILGIWSHWDIENNTFSSMIYTHGDRCGNIDRKVKVLLECGSKEELCNVTEPERCQYTATFKSKYVCHSDALLVYPRLDADLRQKWDQLLTDLHYGIITEKGYQSGLQTLFQLAGLAETRTAKPPDVLTTEASFGTGSTFSDLPSCNKEYRNLQNEISQLNQELEALKLLLDLSKIQNRTNKPQK